MPATNPHIDAIEAARAEARQVGHRSRSQRRFVAVAIPSVRDEATGFRRPETDAKPYVFARSDSYPTITRRAAASAYALFEIVDRRQEETARRRQFSPEEIRLRQALAREVAAELAAAGLPQLECHCMTETDPDNPDGPERVLTHSSDCPEYLP